MTKNGNAAQTAAAEQTAAAAAATAMPRASRSLDDLTDELNVEYVKPIDLQGHRVNLIGARERTGKFGDEVVFEVQYLDGTERGCTAHMSLKPNAVRLKLAQAVKRHGSIGPVRLEKVGEVIDGSKPWGFVSANDPAQTDAFQASGADANGADTGDETDDLPF